MTISDLKLDFLWMPNPYLWLGKTDPFQIKWLPEKFKCKEFLETCSLEDLIRLYLISYKDKYPKDVWFAWLSNGEASDHVKKIDGWEEIDGKYFTRKDIYKYKDKYKKDKDDFSYTSDRMLIFNKSINFSQIIEEELKGKQYSKTENGSVTTYKLTNNPIDFIEVTENSFRLKVNDKFHVHMR